MKKYVFLTRTTENNSGWILKLILWTIGALLLGYICYPKVSLARAEGEFELVRKIGDKTYYKVGEKVIRVEVDNPVNIGEKQKIKVKLKDHPNFKEDSDIEAETYILFVYAISFLIGIIGCIIQSSNFKLSKGEWGPAAFMIISALLAGWMLILWTI